MSRVVDPSDALDSIDIGEGNSAGNHTQQQQQQIPSDQKSDKGYLCIGKLDKSVTLLSINNYLSFLYIPHDKASRYFFSHLL